MYRNSSNFNMMGRVGDLGHHFVNKAISENDLSKKQNTAAEMISEQIHIERANSKQQKLAATCLNAAPFLHSNQTPCYSIPLQFGN